MIYNVYTLAFYSQVLAFYGQVLAFYGQDCKLRKTIDTKHPNLRP